MSRNEETFLIYSWFKCICIGLTASCSLRCSGSYCAINVSPTVEPHIFLQLKGNQMKVRKQFLLFQSFYLFSILITNYNVSNILMCIFFIFMTEWEQFRKYCNTECQLYSSKKNISPKQEVKQGYCLMCSVLKNQKFKYSSKLWREAWLNQKKTPNPTLSSSVMHNNQKLLLVTFTSYIELKTLFQFQKDWNWIRSFHSKK